MKARLNGKLTRLCRRTLCVVLALMFAAAMVPWVGMRAFAAENLTCTLEDGVLTISGTGTVNKLEIPPALGYYPSASSIKSVVFNAGITGIGDGCFMNFNELTSVNIPNTVNTIGERAFASCTKLTSVIIPYGVDTIGSNAFDSTALSSVTVPGSVTSVGYMAFSGDNLSSVTFESDSVSVDKPIYRISGTVTVTIYRGFETGGTEITEDNKGLLCVGPSSLITLNLIYRETVPENSPTCEQDGNSAYNIGALDKWYDTDGCFITDHNTVNIPAVGHKLTNKAAKAETCEENGNTEYWECFVCNKLFSDSEGENEITAPTVIPAAGHNYGDLIAEVPPSHSVNGTKAHYHCSVCGKDFDESKNEITDLTISNAPHGEPDETQWKCDGINHWRICKADGCGEVIESTKAAHTFEWKTDSEPTLAEAGTKHEECTVCGFKRSENTAIEKITYSYTDSGYSWKKRSGKDLAVTVKRSYKDELTAGNFSRLEIDGKTVDSANFSTAPGSVVITLKKSYLESGAVSVGKHTVTAYFSDGGKAETKLTVTSSGSGTTPGTGDDTRTNDLVSGMILFIVSLSFVSYTLYANKLARAKLLAVFSGAQADVREDGSDDIMPKEHLDGGFDDIIADEPADDGFDDIIPD